MYIVRRALKLDNLNRLVVLCTVWISGSRKTEDCLSAISRGSVGCHRQHR